MEQLQSCVSSVHLYPVKQLKQKPQSVHLSQGFNLCPWFVLIIFFSFSIYMKSEIIQKKPISQNFGKKKKHMR